MAGGRVTPNSNTIRYGTDDDRLIHLFKSIEAVPKTKDGTLDDDAIRLLVGESYLGLCPDEPCPCKDKQAAAVGEEKTVEA